MLSTAWESLRPWHLRSRLAPAGLTTLLHGGRPPLQPPSSSVLSEGLARSRLSVTSDTGFLLFPYHLPTSSLLCVFTALTFFCLESSHSSFKSCPIAASPGKSFTFLPPYPHPLNKVRSLLYNPSGLSRRCITANITVLLHSLLHMLCTPPPRTPHGQPLCPAIGHGAWTMCWKRGSEQGCMLCTFNDTRGVAVQHKVSWGLYSHEQTNCDG